jgi:enterochelin esterase family protein
VGTVEIRQFFSPSLQQNRGVFVYLPEGYDPGGLDRYPVIYFLHGANCSHTVCYEYLISSLDDLIGTGEIEPVIWVKPDGSGCPWGGVNGCSWTNGASSGEPNAGGSALIGYGSQG